MTERCDTACSFCAYDVTLQRLRRELDAAEALRFGALVAARGPALVSWLGGEPFLWKPLRPVSAALRGLGLRVALTTSGRALADPARRDWVLEGLDEITLSLDGPPALHDQLRRRAGLGETVEAALRDLASRRIGGRPLLRVNSVLMAGNAGAFAELVARVADAGADELTFNALGGNDRPEFHARERLLPAHVARLAAELPEVRALARARGLVVRGGEGYLARLAASAGGRALPVADCGPGTRFWFIEVDGRLAPCSFTAADYGVDLRTLATPADLDALPARFHAARAARAAASCADCPSTQQHAKFDEAGA